MVRIGLFRRVLSAVLISVISLTLIAWLAARHLAMDQAERQFGTSLQSDLQRLAQYSSHWLTTTRSFLEYSAGTETFQSMNPVHLQTALSNLEKFIPTSNESMVLDLNGNSITHDINLPTQNFSNQRYFKTIRHHGESFAFQMSVDSTTGQYVMLLAVPINNNMGDLRGILVSAINPKAFQSQVKSLFLNSQRDYLVLAADSSVVVSTAHPTSTNSIFDLQGKSYPTCNLNGVTELTSHEHFEPHWGKEMLLSGCMLESDWHAIVFEDPKLKFAAVKRVDRLAVIAIVALFGVAFFSSLILTRLVIDRLNRLSSEIVDASISGKQIGQDNQDDEFTQFSKTVSVAMYGQTLLNQLVQCSYHIKTIESFIHESLKLIQTAPWFSTTTNIKLFITLTDNPDLFHQAQITNSNLIINEIYFEELDSNICDCISTNQLIHKSINQSIDSYSFPIYLDNMSGACLYIEFDNKYCLDDQQTHFTLTFLDVFSSVINHLNASFSLQQQEELTHQIIDNSDLIIVVRALSGEITLCSKGFEELYGVDRSIYLHFMSDMLSPEQQFQLQHNDEVVIFQGKTVNYDEPIELESGENVYLQTVKFPIKDSNGQVSAIGSVSTNISSRLKMERQIQASYHNLEEQVLKRTRDLHNSNKELTRQKFELEALVGKLEEAQTQLIQSEKLASIGQLAAGVAHEINNPVGFVNSNLGSLRKHVANLILLIEKYESTSTELPSPLSAEVKALKEELDFEFLIEDVQELIDESIEGVERVKKIVLDLKSFSRADRGDWEEINLHDCLDSTINVVWNEVKYKADLERHYQDIPAIICNASQINQVIMNLLVNAVQALKDFGKITINTGSDDRGVWVKICDTGSGIPESVQSRIFDPFFTTKEIGKGTGLGLSISYNIVNSHGGDLSFESSHEGTCFRLWLPFMPPASQESASHSDHRDASVQATNPSQRLQE